MATIQAIVAIRLRNHLHRGEWPVFRKDRQTAQPPEGMKVKQPMRIVTPRPSCVVAGSHHASGSQVRHHALCGGGRSTRGFRFH
jgi:hypothetical protein